MANELHNRIKHFAYFATPDKPREVKAILFEMVSGNICTVTVRDASQPAATIYEWKHGPVGSEDEAAVRAAVQTLLEYDQMLHDRRKRQAQRLARKIVIAEGS